MSVAASSDLHDPIKWTESTVGDREIEVHPAFDDLRADQSYGFVAGQSLVDLSQNIPSMRAAQERREMERVPVKANCLK